MTFYSMLPDRAVLGVSGEDARDFLQGLITKDMSKVTPEKAVFAVLLSPQGRFLFDFFLTRQENGFWLETDKARLPELIKRLTMYRLRAKVELKEIPLQVLTVWDVSHPELANKDILRSAAHDSCSYRDPRLPGLGWRILFDPSSRSLSFLPAGGAVENTQGDYEAHRLSLGVPEGVKDMTLDRSILLEYGYDELNAIDFDKGCYVGQEVTARSKHRASLRKFIHHIKADGPLFEKGTLLAGDREVGLLTSANKNQGLAHLNVAEVRRAAREGHSLTISGMPVKATLPAWCKTAFEGD